MPNEEEKKEDKAAKKVLTPEEQDAKSSKRKKLIFIIGGVIAAAGIGGGAFFFLAGGDNGSMAAKATSEGETVAAEDGATPEGDENAEEGGEHSGDEQSATPKEGEATATKEAAKPGEESVAIDFGCTYSLKPFNLNLGNPLENRYIQLELSIEYGCADAIKTEMEKRLPQLRDAVISVVGTKTREALLSPDGKAQLTKEIHHRLNHYMTHKLDNVFITDFLIE